MHCCILVHTHANTYKHKVVGVDYSGKFIDAAVKLQQGKSLVFGSPKEVATVPIDNGVDVSRVTFKQVLYR